MKRLGLIALALLAACEAPPPTPVSAPVLRAEWVDPSVGAKYLSPEGQPLYPPEDGFLGTPVPLVLPPGTLLDRFGGDGGRFLAPRNAAFAARALPGKCEGAPYSAFRVAKPLPVLAGPAAPWFDRSGRGLQFRTDATVAQLLSDRVLEKLRLPAPGCS